MDLRANAFRFKTGTVRRAAGKFYGDLLSHQALPRDDLDRLVNQRSRAIATFAFEHSPFYRHHLQSAGVSVASLDDPGVWSSIPVIDRSVVKEHGAEFVTRAASEPRNARGALTGGSTGQPLRTLHDARVPKLALSWRMYGWWGVQPWDNLARVGRWGFGKRAALKNTVTWWPTKQAYLDASLIDDDSMKQFVSEITALRPGLLEGYVGAMLELARYVEANRVLLPALRAVATTAAPLTEDARSYLQHVFKAPVYDEYRGSEVGWMAGECSYRSGLHVFADVHRIEIVDDDGLVLPAGELGNIVVTDLYNRVHPLIRYQLGDRGMLLDEGCPCGVSLPLMAKPEGRTTDVLRLPSGKIMNHRLFSMFSEFPESVQQFQIHQRADYSIKIKVIPGASPDALSQIDRAVSVLRDRVGGEVEVRTVIVDSLPYVGGKLKYVTSDVPSQEPRHG